MRIACWQPSSPGGETAVALAGLRGAAAAAADAGAGLLVTPELSLTGYHLGAERLRALAEPADGPLCRAVGALAAEYGVATVFGWPERVGAAVYNTVRLVDGAGRPLATYRKAHLYGDLDRAVFSPGQHGLVQAVLGGLTVGLLICYDVEFPESVRAHAVHGTELLVVPTALMRPWEFVARTLVPTRAFESQLFLAYANWVGPERELDYCGLSQVVGPDGQPRASLDATAGLLLADIDPTDITLAGAGTPYLRDRRPELYPALSAPPG
jgi:predicted amidohydrolase